MSDQLVTRIGTILNGTASGLLPLAIFTLVYALWPILAWPAPGIVFFLLAAAWSAYLAVSAARLLRLGREPGATRLTTTTSAAAVHPSPQPASTEPDCHA